MAYHVDVVIYKDDDPAPIADRHIAENETFEDANVCARLIVREMQNWLKRMCKEVNECAEISIILKRDGDSWCAHWSDFKNLQESPAGFGDTGYGALAALFTGTGDRTKEAHGTSL